jgi:hypothetical protein
MITQAGPRFFNRLRGAKFLERSQGGSRSIELCDDDIGVVEEGLAR